MSIDGISRGIRGIGQPPSIEKPVVTEKTGQGKPFNEMLTDALQEVDQLQKSADQHIEGLSLGKEGFTSHGAAIALEKADIAFQLMNTIRSKIIRAYEEVIRTQV